MSITCKLPEKERAARGRYEDGRCMNLPQRILLISRFFFFYNSRTEIYIFNNKKSKIQLHGK